MNSLAPMRRAARAIEYGSCFLALLAAALHPSCAHAPKEPSVAPTTVVAPRVAGEVSDLGAVHPGKYRASTPLPLLQHWKQPGAAPTEIGRAYAGFSAEGLSLYTYLEDSDIFSAADADELPMPALGDVVEFFVKPGVERSDYWEVHVTPNDFLLDIHILDRAQISKGGGITWEQVVPFTAAASAARRRVTVSEGSWAVELIIPWSAFGLKQPPEAGTVWQFAVCRFNYTGGLDNPELSSTAPITALNFHRFEEHHDLVLP